MTWSLVRLSVVTVCITTCLDGSLARSVRAQSPASPQRSEAAAPVEGLWVAKGRYGPDARGELVIARDGDGWRGDIGGYSVRARASADTVRLALPDSAGWFIGRHSRDGATVSGHWIQPPTAASGTRFASPVVLTRHGRNRWVGEVVPLDDAMTLYLLLRKRPDGTLGAFIRNPERNLGVRLRADRIERAGSELRLIGRINGKGPETTLAAGAARDDGFSLYFGGRGSFDFRRVGDTEYSDFYPRGHPAAAYTYRRPERIADGWATSSPGSVGLSGDSIGSFVRMLVDASMDSLTSQQIHAFLVVRHGTLVVEEYFHGESREHAHDTRSAAKSLTATLAGAAIHAGLPVSLSSPVFAVMTGGHFPAGLEPRKRTITLEHLLSQSAGLDCDDSDSNSPGNEDALLDQEDEPDYYRYILRLRTIREPATQAVYCSINAHLAGGVVQTATRRSLPELFQMLIARPLKIEHYYLPLSPSSDAYMGGGVRLTARAYAKVGQMYLDQGTWKGRRMLDRSFVARATEPRFTISGKQYGLLWWVVDYPYRGRTVRGFYADGNGGQIVMVLPSLDMVVTFFGANYADGARSFRAVSDYVPRYILPAVTGN